jgi:hypothetical protein
VSSFVRIFLKIFVRFSYGGVVAFNCDPRLASTQPEGARPGHPRHRLVNPKLFISPTPYRDALMAGARGRFRGRHGPGRGSPVDRGRSGTASGPGRGAHDRAHATVAGHGGSPPVGASAGRGGLPHLRLLVEAQLLGTRVMVLMDRQARCSRERAVGAPQLTRHQLTLPGGLLMMFKASRRGSARINKSWSVLLHRGPLHKLVSAPPRAKTSGGLLRCCRGWYGLLSDSGCEE